MSTDTFFYGIVILYHPDESVINNIQSYLYCLDHLYLIDNSDHISHITAPLQILSNTTYIANKQNLGIANALNIGAKLAMEAGATWLLTMDQDSAFPEGACEMFKKHLFSEDPELTGIVSPLQTSYLHNDFQTNLTANPFTVITSGNAISLHAYAKTNGFNESYFIDAVDWDYCLQMHEYNFAIKRLNAYHLKHQLGIPRQHQTLFGKPITVFHHNKTRKYYMIRNRLDLACRYFLRYPRFSLHTLWTIGIEVKNTLCYENEKRKKMMFMLQGFADFILRRFGKIPDKY